jgi:two-component system alkaline phosphatase synthesis response regulator PhoP
MNTVLVVEDEIKIAQLVRDYLENAGYRVVLAQDGKTAMAQFRHEQPDLIVLDLNLPGMDGLDVARAVRRAQSARDTPIIMLTARVEEMDRIIGLELGADDYVTKPFSPRELVARVRAVLRRAGGGGAPSPLLRVRDLAIDTEKRLVTRDDERIELTTTEFDLLVAFARAPGRVFSRMELLDRVQGEAFEGYERTIDVHVKNLRKKIERDPRHPTYIMTVYGAGYRLAEG